jgi:hypothetical protein
MKRLEFFAICIAITMLGTSCSDDSPSGPSKTLTLQPNGDEGKDAIVASCVSCSYNDNNYGSTPDFLATAWTNSADESNLRSLIQFDLSSIPDGATIESAELSLFYKNSPGNGDHSTLSGSNAAWLERITDAWTESTVTWDNQPATTSVDQVALPASTSNSQDYTAIDVTAIVKGWVSNPATNFGLKLRLQNETAYRQLAFASSDHTEEAKRPKLVIKYKK